MLASRNPQLENAHHCVIHWRKRRDRFVSSDHDRLGLANGRFFLSAVVPSLPTEYLWIFSATPSARLHLCAAADSVPDGAEPSESHSPSTPIVIVIFSFGPSAHVSAPGQPRLGGPAQLTGCAGWAQVCLGGVNISWGCHPSITIVVPSASRRIDCPTQVPQNDLTRFRRRSLTLDSRDLQRRRTRHRTVPIRCPRGMVTGGGYGYRTSMPPMEGLARILPVPRSPKISFLVCGLSVNSRAHH